MKNWRPFAIRLIPNFDAISWFLSCGLEMTIPPQFCFTEGTLRTGMKQEFATCILAQRSAELGRCVKSLSYSFGTRWTGWDWVYSFEVVNCYDLVVHTACKITLCYTCSLLWSDPLKPDGTRYNLTIFIVDIFSVHKCSLKVWGSKQLLSWVAEQCFGHELVIHCKWFL